MCAHDRFWEWREMSLHGSSCCSALIKQVYYICGHDDVSLQAKAAKSLVSLMSKHEFDVIYQNPEYKFYFAEQYLPLAEQEPRDRSLTAAISFQVLELVKKFSAAAACHKVKTDYKKLDCITSIFSRFFSRSQPVDILKTLLPVFNSVLNCHGAVLMGKENDSFVKLTTYDLLQLGISCNDKIRMFAVIGLRILVESSVSNNLTTRFRVMLTTTLLDLLASVQVSQRTLNGSLEENGDVRRLTTSLKEMADETITFDLLIESSMKDLVDAKGEQRLWEEVKHLSKSLLQAMDATLKHARSESLMAVDRYAAAESLYGLAVAFAPVPDFHVTWLLNLSEQHQKLQSWAEAAQCLVAAAGYIMQALMGREDAVWNKEHVVVLQRICPMVSGEGTNAAEFESYGASKLTVENAMKYLELAVRFFARAELYNLRETIIGLLTPVYISSGVLEQLQNSVTTLVNIEESSVLGQGVHSSDASYYQVGFYGAQLGELDRKVYIYREPHDVRSYEMMEKVRQIYEPWVGKNCTLHIIPNSRGFNPNELPLIQVTEVYPIMEDEAPSADVLHRFSSEKSLENKWKRGPILQIDGSFPALVNRLMVIKTEFPAVEGWLALIKDETAALLEVVEEPSSSSGNRLQQLEVMLQRIVRDEVCSEVRKMCAAFLTIDPAWSLPPLLLQQVIDAVLDFIPVCSRAVEHHLTLIGGRG